MPMIQSDRRSSRGASRYLVRCLLFLATRGDDQRALVRYLVGALVLLGLIGTFYGLLLTIAGVRDVIGGLASEQTTDTMTLIAHFKDRLAAPLGGMGTSFSASLFGLLGALALGFLELQLFHAQNYRITQKNPWHPWHPWQSVIQT